MCLFGAAQAISADEPLCIEGIWLIHGDCLEIMNTIPDKSVDLIYADQPYYCSTDKAFGCSWDSLNDYLNWLKPILKECHRVLKLTGSIYVHLDWHAVHYVKVLLDKIFEKNRMLNEIVWCYKSGGASKKHFSRKHDTILFYSRSNEYKFFPEKEKSYMGIDYNTGNKNVKLFDDNDGNGKYTLVYPKDWWEIPMLATSSKRRVKYPTQKPEQLLERIIKASSDKNNLVLDPFAGSGTTGKVCQDLERNCILIDSRIEAIECMEKRLGINAL